MSYRRTAVVSILLLLCFLLQAGHSAAPAPPEYDLAVSFDISQGKIEGRSKISVVKGAPVALAIGGLAVRGVRVNGRAAAFQDTDGELHLLPQESGSVEIRYEGLFAPVKGAPMSRNSDIPNVIGSDGIFLAARWYPEPRRLARYRLRATLPHGYVAVSEAETAECRDTSDAVACSFDFDHPVDRISLVASDRFRIQRERFRGIELSALFFPEDQRLAAQYLDYAKKYIALYEKLLLPFPFKRFSVVENFLPTGYSMPTYTVLGQEVVRLPFIVETSLGHEILHQWFGNDLYLDDRKGNWAEGLTTYLADHWYQEQKGEGWKYRKQILIDYANYVHGESEFSLRRFAQRFDAASRAIGYGKTAMVFHMLRLRVGDDAFFAALKSLLRRKAFQRVSWDDFRDVFGKDLARFFDQWLDEKGLADLRADHVVVAPNGDAFALSFDLAQAGTVYDLDVPVTVLDKAGGEKTECIRLAAASKHVQLKLANIPTGLVIDPGYDLARKLAPGEIPPVIGTLLGAEKLTVVPPREEQPQYQEILEALKGQGAKIEPAASVKDAALGASTMLLLGSDNDVARRLYGKPQAMDAGFALKVEKNPRNPVKMVGLLASTSAAETKAAWPKISHYGKYSALTFQAGRNLSATIADSDRGMREKIGAEVNSTIDDPPAVDISTLKKLSDVAQGLAGKKIVYVGEQHDKFSHHQVQLEILQALYRQNPKIAVGMEMFQRPFQKALDDYVTGTIDERTFLKRSEYFRRWDIDYHLYKPILDFARERHLPVVALNAPREIVEKVGKSGFDSLTPEEKRQVPAHEDYGDPEYRQRLKEAFAEHQHNAAGDFEHFYQAQILWDETMADSIDRFLKGKPDFRMLVMAGAGHIQYGSGIPNRAYRRNGLPYAIVLSDADIDARIGDYVIFPEAAKSPAAPKLMVMIEDKDQAVRIKGFAENSVSEKAGLKVDDTIVALDGQPVHGIDDIKIALFFKHPGDSIAVKATRMSSAKKPEELEFNVKLE